LRFENVEKNKNKKTNLGGGQINPEKTWVALNVEKH
jgi:hypothetical protein